MATRVVFLFIASFVYMIFAAPDPVITPPPSYLARARLQNRASAFTDTCGFISGNSNSPLTCPQSNTCSFGGSDQLNFLGCCNQLDCAPNQGARICFPRDGASCMGDDYAICTNIYTSILLCTEATAPACVEFVRVTDEDNTVAFTSYSCGPSATEILFLSTPTAAGQVALTSDSSTVGFGLPSPTSAFASSTRNPFQTSTPSSIETSTPLQPSASSGSGGLSKTAIIAIAVIGGIAVIVGLIIAWIYCLSGCFSRCFSRRPNGGSSAWASQAGGSRKKKGRAGRTAEWILQARSMGAGASQNGDVPLQQPMGHPPQGQHLYPGGNYGQNPSFGYNAVPNQGPPAYSDLSGRYGYGR